MQRIPDEIYDITILEQMSKKYPDQLDKIRTVHVNKLTEDSVKCTGLVSLHMDDYELTEFPKDIAKFKNLESLDISGNKITEIPAEIGQLTNLQYLNLGDNKITKLPGEIGNLKSLEILVLTGNELSGLPDELEEISTLKEIYFSTVEHLDRTTITNFHSVNLVIEDGIIERINKHYFW